MEVQADEQDPSTPPGSAQDDKFEGNFCQKHAGMTTERTIWIPNPGDEKIKNGCLSLPMVAGASAT